MNNSFSPTSDGAILPAQSLFVQRQGRWLPNPELLRQTSRNTKTYSTKQVLALLNLPSATPLYAAKNLGLPYFHTSANIQSNRIAVAIKRNTWLIFRP